jgi:hypothetical protein
MKNLYVFLIILFCCNFLGQAQSEQSFTYRPFVTGGITVGYTGGFGIQGNVMVSNFARDFPLSARLGIGYSSLDPGNPADARRIFINDATNGVPEKSGTDWNFRLDFLYRVPFLSMKRFYVFTGARYSAFSAAFNFIDGNEFFNINSNQWGLGLGGESYFMLVPGLDLVFSLGADYYFNSTLEGHDTSYSPDGQNINSRRGYTYYEADQAINQPKVMLRAMLGFNYHF